MTPVQRRLGWAQWALWILVLVLIGVAAGAERIWLSDFLAINGDFQNYNILRRFLDGQVPYRDFTNYLGMGVLCWTRPFCCCATPSPAVSLSPMPSPP